MYLIREVFNAKPGKAKELVKKFKLAAPHFEKEGGKNHRILTDIATDYWTVIVQFEVDDIGGFIGSLRSFAPNPALEEIMKGYMDLLEGGKREIFLVE